MIRGTTHYALRHTCRLFEVCRKADHEPVDVAFGLEAAMHTVRYHDAGGPLSDRGPRPLSKHMPAELPGCTIILSADDPQDDKPQ